MNKRALSGLREETTTYSSSVCCAALCARRGRQEVLSPQQWHRTHRFIGTRTMPSSKKVSDSDATFQSKHIPQGSYYCYSRKSCQGNDFVWDFSCLRSVSLSDSQRRHSDLTKSTASNVLYMENTIYLRRQSHPAPTRLVLVNLHTKKSSNSFHSFSL